MKSKLFPLLFTFIVLLFCSELKAQDIEPCDLPTYDVTASFAPGEVAFDLFEALSNDGYDFFIPLLYKISTKTYIKLYCKKRKIR